MASREIYKSLRFAHRTKPQNRGDLWLALESKTHICNDRLMPCATFFPPLVWELTRIGCVRCQPGQGATFFRFATFKRCNLVRSTHCCKEFPSKIPWRNIGALLAYTRLNVKVETAGVGAELAQVDASSAAFFPDSRVSKLWCLGDC